MKIFWATMVMVFAIVSLQFLGIHAPNLIQPVTEKMDKIFHESKGGEKDASSLTKSIHNSY